MSLKRLERREGGKEHTVWALVEAYRRDPIRTARHNRRAHWARRESNPHVPTGQGILSPRRLPFRHSPSIDGG